MAQDYYQILEVSRTATPAEIQSSYRKLARKYHPDLNPEDKSAKQKFQQVQQAFDTLNDEQKRKLYDQYGPNYEQVMGGAGAGGPRPGAGGGNWTGGQMPPGFEGIDIGDLFGGAGGGDFGGIFEQLRGGRNAGKRSRKSSRQLEPGSDRQQEISVPFQTAIAGGQMELAIPRSAGKYETLTVKVPAGVHDGGKIRLRGQGETSPQGGPPGDLILVVRIAPHPFYSRQNEHLEVRLPVTLSEAIQGAKVDVPTPHGVVAIKIPPGTSSGKRLRIKGHGVRNKDGTSGDLYAVVQIMLPLEIPAVLREAVANMPVGSDPRSELKW